VSSRVVLVGGGLANSLIAYRLAATRPELELTVLERGATLGGNHVWSYHDYDLSPAQRDWLRPLVERSWSHHEVRFPAFRRRIDSPYHSTTSSRLHEVVGRALGDRLRCGVEVRDVSPREVHLADGTTIGADLVIDGRGDAGGDSLTIAYQKFFGRRLELDRDHGLKGPILMDATVEQRDGYRFVYTLPFAERSVLVEDTRYSDTPALDRDELREEIDRYVAGKGWRIAEVKHEESGVLPIILAGDIEAFWQTGPVGVPRSGMRAALFNATTGYSLPEAVRLADDIAGLPRLDSESLYPRIRARSMQLWRKDGYFRLLNRMLFGAADADRRWLVMQRFYRLPEPLIHRFYAGRLTGWDRFRILFGKPPVPIGRALGCLVERRQQRSRRRGTAPDGRGNHGHTESSRSR
jgi:lycopene beta-cyclase